jgi:hypothetical protein
MNISRFSTCVCRLRVSWDRSKTASMSMGEAMVYKERRRFGVWDVKLRKTASLPEL